MVFYRIRGCERPILQLTAEFSARDKRQMCNSVINLLSTMSFLFLLLSCCSPTFQEKTTYQSGSFHVMRLTFHAAVITYSAPESISNFSGSKTVANKVKVLSGVNTLQLVGVIPLLTSMTIVSLKCSNGNF